MSLSNYGRLIISMLRINGTAKYGVLFFDECNFKIFKPFAYIINEQIIGSTVHAILQTIITSDFEFMLKLHI